MSSFLSKDFQPAQNDVLIGRGKKCYNHAGNINLSNIVASRLDEYSCAETKQDKSNILAEIVDNICKLSPNGVFFKHNPASGMWIKASDIVAREKISQVFRDALHEKYKSSNSNKKKQKKHERQIKRDNTSFQSNVVPSQKLEQNEQACGVHHVTKMYMDEPQNDLLKHFASSLHSFDMDMDFTVLEATDHASIVSIEDLDDLSISSETSALEFASDGFSDASFDNELDQLSLEDYSFGTNAMMVEDIGKITSYADYVASFVNEYAIDISYQGSMPMFNKDRILHNNSKATYLTNGEYNTNHDDRYGFVALPAPIHNISVAMTA